MQATAIFQKWNHFGRMAALSQIGKWFGQT